MKKGSGVCDALAAGQPVAILHLQGRYMPGEVAEQWRGEGHCERLPLGDLIDLLPHYTIASMVSSKRIENEDAGILASTASGVRGTRSVGMNKRRTATHCLSLTL